MSHITYADDGEHVLKRQGEFYEVDSCYTTPKSLKTDPDHSDLIFSALEMDVDELANKPRRFFDHLLSVMEYRRDHDPRILDGDERDKQFWMEYWDIRIEGCEQWLSAVNNGLYGEVLRLAEPVKKKTKGGKGEVKQ